MPNRVAIVAVISALFAAPVAVHADGASEIATAAQHAGLAAAATDLRQTHMHLHHVMNCLVGPGDGDFDKSNTNPCAQQGKGAFPDATNQDIKTKLQTALSLAADGIASNDEATAQKDAATIQTELSGIK